MELAFPEEGRSEAPKARREGTESLAAKRGTESPAEIERLMEEVCRAGELQGGIDNESRRTREVREWTE